MAATYAQLGIIANDGIFQQRINYAMMTAAIAIYNESPGTTGHSARLAFAKLVIAGSYNMVEAALAILTNATIASEATMVPTPGANIPDADIQFSANSVWNALAGA
jgi:hypothetical protein